MFKRKEISEEQKKQLRPMAGQVGHAHGLPKTDQLLTLPALAIIMLVNFYYPRYSL